ncbi:MAG: bifunctional demethylmenaquinone methyltransferase/2-methoxy-6-polyprenyl-1,4-benzoquinol methylase UbiE [bacterium]|nr:bifunctional demethylmenaquinone methyltransferase/2-methoxy-6-polyprenyl-1,4-benzoquinol methylase UbiE [bacterium]
MADANSTTSFGFKAVKEDQRQGLVNEVFSSVAEKYDLMNDLMSGGMHRLWKEAFINWLAPPQGTQNYYHLDVAGGTGDIAMRLLKAGNPKARSVICDISGEMLRVGEKRAHEQCYSERLSFVQGNAECLPFPDNSFDAYTIAFGIRNVTHIDQALSEARRVLKRGGRFMCLEFSKVEVPMLDKIYDLFSFNVIPHLGQLTSGDRDSYQYLVESIRKFPPQDDFVSLIEQAGFEQIKYRNLSGGIAAMHSGWKL